MPLANSHGYSMENRVFYDRIDHQSNDDERNDERLANIIDKAIPQRDGNATHRLRPRDLRSDQVVDAFAVRKAR
jgi:hypothetical protein